VDTQELICYLNSAYLYVKSYQHWSLATNAYASDLWNKISLHPSDRQTVMPMKWYRLKGDRVTQMKYTPSISNTAHLSLHTHFPRRHDHTYSETQSLAQDTSRSRWPLTAKLFTAVGNYSSYYTWAHLPCQVNLCPSINLSFTAHLVIPAIPFTTFKLIYFLSLSFFPRFSLSGGVKCRRTSRWSLCGR